MVATRFWINKVICKVSYNILQDFNIFSIFPTCCSPKESPWILPVYIASPYIVSSFDTVLYYCFILWYCVILLFHLVILYYIIVSSCDTVLYYCFILWYCVILLFHLVILCYIIVWSCDTVLYYCFILWCCVILLFHLVILCYIRLDYLIRTFIAVRVILCIDSFVYYFLPHHSKF